MRPKSPPSDVNFLFSKKLKLHKVCLSFYIRIRIYSYETLIGKVLITLTYLFVYL